MYKSFGSKLFATKTNHFTFKGSMVMCSPNNPFRCSDNIIHPIKILEVSHQIKKKKTERKIKILEVWM